MSKLFAGMYGCKPRSSVLILDEAYQWFDTRRETRLINQLFQQFINQTRHTQSEETDIEMAIRILNETDPWSRWMHG